VLKKHWPNSEIHGDILNYVSVVAKNEGIDIIKEWKHLKEKENQTFGTYNLLLKRLKNRKKNQSVNNVEKRNGSFPTKSKEGEDFVQKNADIGLCEERMLPITEGESGCKGTKIQTGKMAMDMLEEKGTMQKLHNGEEKYSQGTITPAESVDYDQNKKDNSTHTTLKDGKNIPNYDLLNQTELHYAKNATKKNTKKEDSPYILTGGFPCQGFSQAGLRRGREDDRYLWPETFAVIKLLRPKFIILENVRGILNIEDGMVFEQVCLDLEGEGYEVRAFIIPAVAVGAPHRRDRVWFVAHNTQCERLEREKYKESKATAESNRNTPNAKSNRPNRRSINRSESRERQVDKEITNNRNEVWSKDERCYSQDWSRNWKEVAFTTCYDRMDDGFPRQMDGTTISAARHRKERLKACGNAIVPQVAMKIIQGIKEIEQCKL
jgi:DNA (cytosine-5)-methyltransferase 1